MPVRHLIIGPPLAQTLAALAELKPPSGGFCPECNGNTVKPSEELHGYVLRSKCTTEGCGLIEETLMRILPCTRCGEAKTADTSPYLMGGNPMRFPFTYVCAGCKKPNTLTTEQWGQLPLLGPDEWKGRIPDPRQVRLEATVARREVKHVENKDRKGALIPPPARPAAPKIPIQRIPLADVAKHVPKR